VGNIAEHVFKSPGFAYVAVVELAVPDKPQLSIDSARPMSLLPVFFCLQAIGCLGMRACNSNNCPVGIATQKENLRQRLVIDQSAGQLKNFLVATTELMKVVARACGHNHFRNFNFNDLSTLNYDMHRLTGIPYAGIDP
jgi:hypothetical protein